MNAERVLCHKGKESNKMAAGFDCTQLESNTF